MFELEWRIRRSENLEVPFFRHGFSPFAEFVVEDDGSLYHARLGSFKTVKNIDTFSPEGEDGERSYFVRLDQDVVHVACAEDFVEA